MFKYICSIFFLLFRFITYETNDASELLNQAVATIDRVCGTDAPTRQQARVLRVGQELHDGSRYPQLHFYRAIICPLHWNRISVSGDVHEGILRRRR